LGRAFSGCSIDSGRAASFQPADPDFASNLFEIGDRPSQVRLAGNFASAAAKAVRQAELETRLEIGGLIGRGRSADSEIRLVESPVRPRRCARPFPILAANDRLTRVIDLGHLKGVPALLAVP